MAVKPIPDGYHAVTPYLVARGAADLIDFIQTVFGAKERFRMPGPNGLIGHAELDVGDSLVMLGDADTVDGNRPFPAMLMVYVEDVDAVYKKALGAGATSEREPENQFYGDRNAAVRDAWGNVWFIGTHVEDVPPEEMARRSAEFAQQQATAND